MAGVRTSPSLISPRVYRGCGEIGLRFRSETISCKSPRQNVLEEGFFLRLGANAKLAVSFLNAWSRRSGTKQERGVFSCVQ